MIILKKRKKKVAKKKPESVSAQWYQFATPEFGKTHTLKVFPQKSAVGTDQDSKIKQLSEGSQL